MRIGIVGLLHESNTFLTKPTEFEEFQNETLIFGNEIRDRFTGSHHELGGFLDGLEALSQNSSEPIETIPIFVARAFPSGTVSASCWSRLMEVLVASLREAGPLDGLLLAPHGATVSESQPDADGFWLSLVRALVGPELPIVATIDPHANLTPQMVSACNAILAYRTNPHLDQRDRGLQAAEILVRTIRGEITPTMHAVFPPLAMNIERQMTGESPLCEFCELADRQLLLPGVLSNSIVLGFPYADVAEMGSAVIAVTDNDLPQAKELAAELATRLWNDREGYRGRLIDIEAALDECARYEAPVCLLDMGDNVGGGSAADGTFLAQAISERGIGPAFVCLFDPEAVKLAEAAGEGSRISLSVGGKTDDQHGPPLTAEFRVRSFHEGKFRESQARHGGFTEYDQGRTAILETSSGLTVMLTSRRMVPFSLQQLFSCGLDSAGFRILVAKGVNAPLAAYREVCPHFIRVNTPGSTCADMTQLPFRNRRRPLFPFEAETSWSID